MMAEPGLEELRKAREAAHRLLARRARSVAEIKSKLAERRFSPAVIRRTVERLASVGYLDDTAFARSHARYLMEARPMGRRRLSWELSRKGIEKGLVEEAVEEVWAGRSEREVAREVAMRRLEAYRGLDETTVRRRLKGYLERRGFPHGDIVTILREISSL
ncbi:MAG: regulatory protein RecX [Nitrospinae bacterium]|nr:regulatory protein RecX [Nitrospinota bacterium]